MTNWKIFSPLSLAIYQQIDPASGKIVVPHTRILWNIWKGMCAGVNLNVDYYCWCSNRISQVLEISYGIFYLQENFNIVLEICNSIISANTPSQNYINFEPSFVTITNNQKWSKSHRRIQKSFIKFSIIPSSAIDAVHATNKTFFHPSSLLSHSHSRCVLKEEYWNPFIIILFSHSVSGD